MIDINDLKNHLTSQNSQTTLNTLKKSNLIEQSSQSNLINKKDKENEEIQEEKIVNHTYNKNVTKNKIELHSSSCCCCRCFGLFSLLCQAMNCFSGWCLRPCCSTAGLLGGLGAIGGLLAGVMFMGIFGIIPIPYELTRNICNATHERNNFYYHHNFTIIKTIERNDSINKSMFIKKNGPF